MATERTRNQFSAAAGIALTVAALALTPLGAFFLFRHLLEKPGLREGWTEGQELASEAQGPHSSRPFTQPVALDPLPPPRLPKLPRQEPPPLTQPLRALAGAQEPARGPIAPGMERAELIRAWGKPHMMTSRLENGIQVETYHYLDKDSGTEIIVRLRAGRVDSVLSTPY